MRHLVRWAAMVCLMAFPHLAAAGNVGGAAPVFTAPLLQGGDFNLSDHLGKKVILLDWWSINCVPCVQAMPALIDLHNRYPDDLLVVGMNVDAFILKRVERFLATQSFKVTYPTVVDKQLAVMKQYEGSILPTTVLIDKQGRIAFTHVGYKPGDEVALEEKLREIIATN